MMRSPGLLLPAVALAVVGCGSAPAVMPADMSPSAIHAIAPDGFGPVGVTSGWVFYLQTAAGRMQPDIWSADLSGGAARVAFVGFDDGYPVTWTVGDHVWAQRPDKLEVFPAIGKKSAKVTAVDGAAFRAASDDGAWLAGGDDGGALTLWHDGARTTLSWPTVDLVGDYAARVYFTGAWGVVAHHVAGGNGYTISVVDLAHATSRDVGDGFDPGELVAAGDHAVACRAGDGVSIDLAAATAAPLGAHLGSCSAVHLTATGHVAVYAAGGTLWRATLVPTPIALPLASGIGAIDRLLASPDDNFVAWSNQDLVGVASATATRPPLYLGNGKGALALNRYGRTSAFTTDGRFAFFLTAVAGSDWAETGTLTLVDLADGTTRDVAAGCTTAFAAAGGRIVYTAASDGYAGDLMVLDTAVSGGAPQPLAHNVNVATVAPVPTLSDVVFSYGAGGGVYRVMLP